MERQGFDMPLLIGGATTSRVHTAVKIDPNYRAARWSCQRRQPRGRRRLALLSPERREAYAAEVRAEYAKISAAHFRAQADKKRLKLADARANACQDRFGQDAAEEAGVSRHQEFSPITISPNSPLYRLDAVLPDLGTDRALSRHSRRSEKVGEVARSLYDDARKMLERIIKEKWFKAQADDRLLAGQCRRRRHLVYADEAANQPIATFHTLRQQMKSAKAASISRCRISSRRSTAASPDYIGAFVVTAGIGEDVIADRFKNANDDYSSILCKALADRLAEAFAERMHARVRREFWGYAPDETLLARPSSSLEQYRGIRPAPGYPAQPDHTEKARCSPARCREHRRREAHRELRDVAGLVGVGALFQPSRKPLFRRRQDRARPGRGLRRAQGLERRRSRTLAGAGAELYPGAARRPPRLQLRLASARLHFLTFSPARCIWPIARRQGER
jgi:5-methyltetrahydrofolate--homocysteine methyltransferase